MNGTTTSNTGQQYRSKVNNNHISNRGGGKSKRGEGGGECPYNNNNNGCQLTNNTPSPSTNPRGKRVEGRCEGEEGGQEGNGVTVTGRSDMYRQPQRHRQ
jgi:hypothetical protein